MDGSASRFTLYKIREWPERPVEIIDILHQSILELYGGVSLLGDSHKHEQLHKVLEKVNTYESDADALFEFAITELFEREKGPIDVIKLKEIYVGLETAMDKCEDAANVLEAILTKHA